MIAANRIFDFWGILNNEIIGDVWLTIFLIAGLVIYLTIKLKMPLQLQIIFIILILSALFSQTLIIIIWIYIVLMAAAMFYWMLSKSI